MNRTRQITVLVVFVALLAATALQWQRWRSTTRNADFPDGSLWVCTDPKCAAEVVKTVREVGQFFQDHPDGQLNCPKCQAPLARAQRCPHCQHLYVSQRPPLRACPHCQQPLLAPTAAGG